MAWMLSEEQRELKQLVGEFMKNELLPHRARLDISGEFPLEIYKKAFEMGIHMMKVPEEYGGSGLDNSTFGIILEEMGYYDPGFAITILCSMLAMSCILNAGTEEQKRRAGEIFENGGFGAYCLTEPSCGSDAAALITSYKREGEEFIINGSKTFITNGEYSDIFVVFATKDKSLGAKGISAFIVEKGTKGLIIGKHEDKMGLRLSNTCDVVFEDVRIPAENLLGEEGKGFNIAMAGLDSGRLNNASIATGLAQAALDEAVKYAKIRHSFGKPIIRHQAVQVLLANMATRVEASRLLVRTGMQKLDAGLNITMEAAMAKSYCSDTAMQVTTDAVQIFGGYGYSREYPVEKMMRDAKIFQIFEGANEIQRMVIARELEKRAK